MKLGQILNFSREKVIAPPNTKTFTVGALIVALLLPMFGYAMIQAGNSTLTRGVGDVTNAMWYETNVDANGLTWSADATDADKIIGSPLSAILDSDDSSTTVAPAWPMNFFGTKFEGLCITTNGTVSPVLTSSTSCSNRYDNGLKQLAQSAQAPLIAAFANDVDGSEDIRPHLGLTIASATFAAPVTAEATERILTIVTSAPHQQTGTPQLCVWFTAPEVSNGANSANWPTNEFWYCGTIAVSQTSTTTFTMNVPLTFSRGSSMNITSMPTAAITPIESRIYNPSATLLNNNVNLTQTTEAAGFDGFGHVTAIYYGTATIRGKEAMVITWYRHAQNDDRNAEVFYNTFQIVLMKNTTTAGATAGFDFDFEFNYGTIQDGDDGYSASSGGSSSCSSMTDNCRTGVGVADFAVGLADEFELFPDTPSRALVDWGGTSALTKNSLNATVNGVTTLGRYAFTFTGGRPTNFAVPVMDGTGQTLARPEPLDPIVLQTPPIPGAGAYLIDGTVTSGLTVAPDQTSTGLVLTGPQNDPFEMLIGAKNESTGELLELDAERNVLFTAGKFVSVSGQGFKANSNVKVYLFSTPLLLGTVTTDANGAFTASLPLPPEVTPGDHTIQANGFRTNGSERSVSLGVKVTSAAIVSSGPVYNGPIVLSMTPGRAPTTGGSEVYLSGIRLDRTTGVFVNGVELEIVSKRGNELIFKTQSLPAGKYKVVVVSEDGTFTFESLVISDEAPVSLDSRSTRFIPGFASYSSALTPAMKSQIRKFLENHPEATLVSCKGYTSGPIRLPADQRLSNARSKAACEFLKQVNPELEVKVVRGKTDYRVGAEHRKLRLRVLG